MRKGPLVNCVFNCYTSTKKKKFHHRKYKLEVSDIKFHFLYVTLKVLRKCVYKKCIVQSWNCQFYLNIIIKILRNHKKPYEVGIGF